MSLSNDLCRQYFTRPAIHIFFLGFMGSFVLGGIFIGLVSDAENSVAGWFIAGFMLFLTAIFYLPFIWSMRVKLSAEGVLVRAAGCKVSTTWDNLEQFYRAHGPHFGLVTRAPMSGRGVEKLRLYRNLTYAGEPRYDEAERQWFFEGRYLPLRGFDHIVRSGVIQREIARHRPGLPGLEAEPPPVPATEKGPVKYWVWVLIAVCILAGIFTTQLPPEIERRIDRIIGFILCAAGSLRVAISSISCWRGGLRLLGSLYAILAVMLALLSIAALAR